MPRLSNSQLRNRNNKGAHQRRRTTRGHRMITKFEKYKWYDKSFEGKDGVHTYVKLKNGEIWILWSEDHENETMTIYPKFIENFDPETDHWRLKTVNHDEVLKTDTNLACL